MFSYFVFCLLILFKQEKIDEIERELVRRDERSRKGEGAKESGGCLEKGCVITKGDPCMTSLPALEGFLPLHKFCDGVL